MLDIKYTDNNLYHEHVGCDIGKVMGFLSYLNQNHISTTLRQVIIPTLNDNDANILALRDIIAAHNCIDHTELLPFRKICQVKYDKLGIQFPFTSIPEPDREHMSELEKLLKS